MAWYMEADRWRIQHNYYKQLMLYSVFLISNGLTLQPLNTA